MKLAPIAMLALVVLVSACGQDSGTAGPVTGVEPTGSGATTSSVLTDETSATTQPEATTTTVVPAERFVQIFLVQDGQYARAVTRAIPDAPGVAAGAIKALIEGLTDDEAALGLSNGVPADTLLLGLTIDDGLATIDLSKEFEVGGGSFGMLSRLAQVVYTLTEFDTVDRVLFWIDGEPRETFSGEGILIGDPVDRSDFESVLPLTPPAERWAQGDLPAVNEAQLGAARNVVLVTEDDVLNVRSGAGVDNAIIGMLDPDVTVIATGRTAPVGSSTWVEIETPVGPGWVNGFFLDPDVAEDAFVDDADVMSVLEGLGDAMASAEALGPFVSSRGLFVAHNADPVRFEPDQLSTIMTDPTTYRWGSAALEPDSPEIPLRTFAEAIGDRFVSVISDDDLSVKWDEPEAGGNGRIPEYAIPYQLSGFHYVSLYDPGDNPEYGGLDWTSWYASIAYEDGHPVVVALTLDEWSP